MDRMPGGGAPDGAFERFLTAALATIITIMFSWRLLQEENEASGANDWDRPADRDPAMSPQSTDFEYHRQARSRYKKLERERSPAPVASPRPSLGSHYDISLDELDDNDDLDTESHVNSNLSSNISPLSHSSVHETVTYDRFVPVTDRPLGAHAPSTQTADSLTQVHGPTPDLPASGEETLTTWDDYNWQEETGAEQEFVIKSRRSVRDFAKSKQNALQIMNNNWSALANKNTDSKQLIDNQTLNDQAEARANVTPTSSPHLSFSQRLASFEYSDTGGDSGYVDLYPDVDTDESGEEESSDEEHEYEIQVSDSDSDSPDERGGGSFYGITTLDTIFEEFESDIEDEGEAICDKGDQIRDKWDKGPLVDKIGRYVPRIPSDREANVDNSCSSEYTLTDVKQTEPILNTDLTGTKQVEPVLNENLKSSGPDISEMQQSLPVQEEIQLPVCCVETETSPSPFSHSQNNFDTEKENNIVYALHSADGISIPSHAETSEYNISSTILNTADENKHNSIHKTLVDSNRSENSDPIDYDVNNTAPLNSGISHQNASEDVPVTGHRLSNINRQAPVTEIGGAQRDTGENNVTHSDSLASTLQMEFSKLQEKMKVARLGQLQKDSTSEVSEESSPSSPVRNIGPDHLADDRFSDTESCSSESVITVISVKSNDSDGAPGERLDVTRDSCVTPVHILGDMAAGGDPSDQLTRINTSDSSYEHNSLVSGFLNDSLNSLLSSNNINEMGAESDVDISELERQNSSSNDEISDNAETKISISEISPHSTDDTGGEQSESSSKTSSADSLSLVLARVQETNQINTELSNQAASNLANTAADELRIDSRISDALTSHDLHILDDDDDVTDRFIGSDSSSDSSDPPLREYDPDDDDLAAFQFNQDVDNDSFYLLVGDEGSLRNYDTFTNLNSIGLSTDYHDAFTSRTFPEEARGFTFSRTEDLGTQFRTQGYFTERAALSDSDTPSDKGLSPIASEDEEIQCLPESEPFPVIPIRSEQIEHVMNEQPIGNLSHLDKYKDAELSNVLSPLGTLSDASDQTEKKSIDFQKYIIQPEMKTGAINADDQEGTCAADSQNDNKDPVEIDKEFIETKGSQIDNDQCTIDRSGVNSVNNTVGTNDTANARVPKSNSTETRADTLLFNVEGSSNTDETDLDQYVCTDRDPIREDEEEIEDYSDNNRTNIVGKEAKFEHNDNIFKRDLSKVRDTDRTSKPLKTETNIDDLFTESNDINNSVTVVLKPENSPKLDNFESLKTQNKISRETCIDDIFVESNVNTLETSIDETAFDRQQSDSNLSQSPVSLSPIETNVDDLFEQSASSVNSSRSNNGNKSRETNIDDIWDEPTTSREPENVTSPRQKIETNIDDIWNEPITPRASVDVKLPRAIVETNIDDILSEPPTSRATVDIKQSRAKIETNIDDIFDDDVIPVKVSPVQSTPFKHTQPKETSVDDILSDDSNVTKDNQTRHKKSVETFVDNLFGDVDLTENEIAQKKQDTPVNTPQSVHKLSYETFVDDLFSDVLSNDDQSSSLTISDSNVKSSKRAINPERSSSIKDSQTHIDAPQSVHEIDIVSPAVCSVQQSLPDEFNSANPRQQIEREIETNKTADPEPELNIGLKSLSSSDNTRGDVDLDNDCLNLNVNRPVSVVECQNTQSIQEDPSTAKIRDQKIGSYDNSEPQICTIVARNVNTAPPTYGQDNGGGIDTIIDGNDIIAAQNSIEHSDTLLKVATERETAIKDSPNNAKLSPDSNYDYLNEQKHRDIDYNANVSLPKSGGLNIVTNFDNRTNAGLSPAENNLARTNSPFRVELSDTQAGSLDEVENIVETLHEQYGITNANDIVLKIVEEDLNRVPDTQSEYNSSADQDTFSSIGSCSIHSDDDSLSSIEESYHSLQSSYNSTRLRGLSDSAIGRVVRSPVVKPSAIFGKSKDYHGVKRRVHKHQLKKYTSILQQPITLDPDHVNYPHDSPEKPISVTRLKVLQSRQRFLSAENLSNNSFEDRFLQYRTSLTSSTPRKYLKRHERSIAELQSTESLPANMSAVDFMHSGYGSYNSMDRIHSLPVSRQIDELYNSRYSSANSSFERRDYDKLHANCMFTPEKREEIRHTTKSLENMFEQLLRYGSVSSLATETDLDAANTPQPSSFHPDIDITDYVSFQYPLERAASMSALTGSNEGHRLPRKPGKGRFASRNVPKSKSLQTLETNLDDAFASEDEFAGELKKVPSVHELRVSKSLSKLHVPDWFRKSSFSRSGSTQSLFTYASRQGSTSTLGSSIYPCSITTSPSPSVTPGSQTVIISKRVTASPNTPTSTAKLLRAPLLPTTPERSPIHNIPPATALPSDRFRTNEKKELKPIAIVPFAKLREMFEKKALQDAQKKPSKSPVTSPTEEKPPSKVRFEPTSLITKESSSASMQTPKRESVIDYEPVQNNNRTISPPPAIPDRKPILSDSSRKSENTPLNAQPTRKMQVHFSDEKKPVEHKRRYSSILENGFAEQMDELQDRGVAFNFPVVSLGKHSGGEPRLGSTTTAERSPDLQVVLTNAYSNHSAPYDYVNNKLRNDASMDDILDGLLLLDGHSTGRLRMDENGRIVPKYPEDFSPDTPPGFTMNPGDPARDMYRDGNDNSICDVPDSEYMLVKCENAECKRETNLKEAKLYFKACHSCFTYYCSRQCRKDDWTLHKKTCIYSRINSACKHVIKCINRQPDLQYQCSRIARRGYLAQGRGCVMFAFPDISSSEDFLSYGFESLWVPPVYVSLRELPNASMLGGKLEILTETCMNYNPELKYVIHIAIVIPPKLPARPIPRRNESIIQKSAKLRLSPAHMHPRQESTDEIPSTLILTAVPGNQHADDVDGQKTRELCFINIQRKLRQRGVSLRHQFPDVYNKLIDFVSDAKHFSPMIIYPSDGRTGRKFMCVIMPESEPEIEWIRDPNLFRELDVFEEEEVTTTPNLSLNLHEVLL